MIEINGIEFLKGSTDLFAVCHENFSYRRIVVRLTILTLFFFSGVTQLMYEISWIRKLTLVFGSTTLSVSAILTSLMAGLSLGSFLFLQNDS